MNKNKNWEWIPNKPSQLAKGKERRLTLDLLLLRLEGRACSLSRLLQAKDCSFLFLDVLVQILVGDAQLVQLPVEPLDFLVPELEGGPRLLERSTLPLELALCLLRSLAFMLEDSSGLLESGSLLLEPSLRLLVRALLLLKLPLRRGERGSLLCQLHPQLLNLHGLLLGLALPRPCSLEGLRSCWSWARVEATSVSHSATTVRIAARSLRAFRRASSHSRCAAMDTEPAPCVEDWRAKHIAWMDRGQMHRQDGQIVHPR
jgi:hypothetical protein